MQLPSWTPHVLLVALVAVAYHAAPGGTFVFDDRPWIVENPDLATLWPPWVAMGETFRPLLFYGLALNRAVGGLEPWSYLLVNVALHAATALALQSVLRRLLRLPRIDLPEPRARAVAFAAAALWAVHPLVSQAVVYVIQRGEVLAALSHLLVLWGLLSASATTGGAARRRLAVAVAAFYVGLGCKESVVVALPAAFTLDAVVISDSARDAWRRRRGFYLTLAAPLVLAPLAVLIASPDHARLLLPDARSGTRVDYLSGQGRVLFEYLRLVVWPTGQSLDHGWVPDPARDLPWAAGAVALLVAVGVGLWRRSWIAWVGLWFFLGLAPSSSLHPLADAMVEHRMYLPLAALSLLTVVGAERALRVGAPEHRRRLLGAAALGALVAVLTVATVRRVAVWTSRASLWSDVVRVAPHHSRGHFNLSVALLEDGQEDEGRRHLERVVELDPGHRGARASLGALLFEQGDPAAAVRHLEVAMSADEPPFQVLTHSAAALIALGRHAEAAPVVEAALDRLEREPEWSADAASLHNNLGVCRMHVGDPNGALPHFERAAELDPRSVESRLNHVRALVQLGRRGEALAVASRARDELPDDAELALAHARLLAAEGRVEDAVAAYVQALRAAPEDPRASAAVAALVVRSETRDATRAALARAAEEHPDDPSIARLVELADRAADQRR